jgi:hypothetical protein
MRLALIGSLVAILGISPATAATILRERADFENRLGSRFVDRFDFQQGYPASFMIFKDSAMSGILGQTRFQSTGYVDHNMIFLSSTGSFAYCGGCNGSFRLSFERTSYGSPRGVFGVGFDIVQNPGEPRYVATVTYGDGSVADVALASAAPDGSGFFALTSPLGIRAIHFGLPGGRPTREGSFAIDNLTIGTSAAVPEPRVWAMMIAGFGALGAAARRRRLSPDWA